MQKAKKLFMLMAMLFCGMAAAWAAQTVTVIQPQNGQVNFSPAAPTAGETVTITVTPDQGYCIHKADIVVSKIINPGSAQGPARIGIAENIEISGIEPTDPTLEANYTFVMPADPINVQIRATFSEAPSYTVSLDPAADTENGDATFRPTEAKKGETVNIELAPVLGYQVSNVTASYMAMSTQTQVDVTKVNDLLYTFVMPAANVNVLPTFELKQFEIKISDNIENGTVTANRPTAGMDEEVILTVTPAEGYQVKEVFYTWYPGGESDATSIITPDENGVYKFNMPFTYDRVLVKATFEKIPYNIIVAETQNGSIQVAEDKTTAGIGEEVTFFAYPDAGYQVSNVSVSYMAMSTQTEVPVTDNNGTYTFTMPAKDVTIAATFELKQYEVLIADGIENGTVASNRPTAGMGEEVILTVTPAEGYRVQEVRYTWYPGGDSDATSAITPDENGVYKFNMPFTYANVMVSAIFEKIPYNIIVAETQNGSIQVAEDKTTAGIGEEVTFFAYPDAGYQVSNVSVSYMAMSTQTEVPVTDNNGTYTFTMPAKDVTIAATFELKQYEVLIADGIENGTVASNRPTAGMGEEVILTVTPAEGYQVQEVRYTWYPGGDSDATSTITPDENGVYKFNMPFTYANVMVSATFEKIQYNITVTEPQNGTVTVNEEKTTAGVGDQVSFYAIPNTGYQVRHVSVSYDAGTTQTQVPLTEDNYTYTFSMPAADVTIEVTFELKKYEVRISDYIENGTVTADKQTAAMDELVTLTVTPDAGYQVKEVHYTWYPGGDSDATSTITPDENGVYKFTMPFTYDCVIVSATFEEMPVKKYNIVVLESENGSAEADKAQAAIGETVTITVTPDAGYELDQLTVTAGYEIQGGGGGARGPRKMRTSQGTITLTKVDDTHFTFVLPETLPSTLSPNYQDNTDFQVFATFKQLPVKKYNIVVLESENGSAEADKAQAAIGETVTITVTPDAGYELDQLTVNAGYEIQGGGGGARGPRKMRSSQGNITVTKVDDTHYTFVLPETLPNTLTPNYQDNTDFQVKATFKKAKVLTPLHTILTEGVDGNDYTVAEAMAVVKVLGGDAYVTDGTDYIRLQLNDAIAEQLIEGNKSLEGTVTGKLDLRDTNPVLVVSELSENAVENDGISTAIQSVDMSQGMVPQVKLAQVVRMSGYWDGNALRAYSAAPQGQSLIITNNHMPANWQVGGNYTVTVAIYLNEAWEAEQPAGGAPRRVKAGDDLDFQNLRGELINLEITTAIDTLLMDSNVADVHYVNVAGQVSDRPFEGINIMVMKLNDGTTRTVKVVK